MPLTETWHGKTFTAMYDESGKVAGCSTDRQAWACHFCLGVCQMRGKVKA